MADSLRALLARMLPCCFCYSLLFSLELLGAGGQGAILELTEANFSSTIRAHEVVVVEFFNPECAFCSKGQPEYEAASKSFPSAVFGKVNGYEETALARLYEIDGYPTIYLFKAGDVVSYAQGISMQLTMPQWLSGYLGTSRFGLMNEMNYENYISQSTIGMVYMCFPPKTFLSDALRHEQVFSQVAQQFPQFPFVYLDTMKHRRQVDDDMGCDKFPTIAMQLGNLTEDKEGFRKPIFRRGLQDADITVESLTRFVQEILAGAVQEVDMCNNPPEKMTELDLARMMFLENQEEDEEDLIEELEDDVPMLEDETMLNIDRLEASLEEDKIAADAQLADKDGQGRDVDEL